jgi:hypothetical protein
MNYCFKRAKKLALYATCFLGAACLGYSSSITMNATPPAVTIYPGQADVPVSITLGKSSDVRPMSITLTGLPSGITASPLTLTAGGTGTVRLTASPAAGQEGFSAAVLPIATSWTAPVTITATAGTVQATSQFALTVSISNASFAPPAADINLPVVKIDTNDAGIVSKTVDVPGTITITSSDGQTFYLPDSKDTDNTAMFHVHGHTTSEMPKLPYDVKLNASADLLAKMGLTCPYYSSSGKPTCDKSKSFVLLANYDDKSLLRNWSASALANAIPIGNGYLNSTFISPTPSGTGALMPWAAHSLFVELYLNGVYEGNYELIEKVKADTHRVNLTELAPTDISSPQVTGGYLMEIDQHEAEPYVFQTPQGLPIGVLNPDFSPEVPEQTAFISTYVNTAETALFSTKFTDPAEGWRAYFDETSAINFYIVNDVMGNVDAGDFYSSNYLYKDQNNPLIYMGPVWDFDISAGNVSYVPVMNPTVPWMQTQAIWYEQWFKDPGFKSDVVTQWNALKTNGVFSSWLVSVRQMANSLEQSQTNNFTRWPILGIEVWPNPQAAGSYQGEADYLLNWLNLRIAYLDSLFNTKLATETTFKVAAVVGGSARLEAQVKGGGTPTGTVTFLSNNLVVGAGSLSEGEAAAVCNLRTGANNIVAVYNGDNKNALSTAAAQSVTVASTIGLPAPIIPK